MSWIAGRDGSPNSFAGKPERAIEAGQIVEQAREEFPAAGNFAATLDQVTGKWPRVMRLRTCSATVATEL